MNDNFKNYIQLLIDNKDKIIHLPEKDIHNLLDYITNLQQELETRQYDINNLTYLLAKEKKEKKYLDELRNANYLSWQDSLSRIEKAVEYIEWSNYEMVNDNKKFFNYLDKLLDILNGKE